MKTTYLIVILLLGSILIACSQRGTTTYTPPQPIQQQSVNNQQNPNYISKQQAENSALTFSNLLLKGESDFKRNVQTSYLEGSTWVVIVIVAGQKNGGLQVEKATFEVDAVKGTISCVIFQNGEKHCGKELEQIR